MDSVIVNLAMLKIGDKVLELEEHINYERQLIAELKQLMREWADVLAPNGELDETNH